jgi:N-carbamoyl-D-amino-acid hydrolase
MMSKELVAAAQLGPASPSRAETVTRIVVLIERAGAQGASFVVFPELALSPYFAAALHDDLTPFSEPALPTAETAPILDAVAAQGVSIVLPFAERAETGLYNSAVLLDSSGAQIGRYQKTHLPGRAEPVEGSPFTLLEKRYFTPGDSGFPVFDSTIGRLGMLICYDRRFPEAYRCLGLAGAEVIAIPYNTPVFPGNGISSTVAGGQGQSELTMRANALANGVFVIAAGKAGVENGVTYIGGSVIIGPTGEVLARATTDGDELVLAEIDRAEGTKIRERLNLDVNRRPDQYELIVRRPVAV